MLQLERSTATIIRPIVKDGVSCVGLINKNGRLDEMVCKDDLPLSKDKREMFYMSIKFLSAMQRDFDAELQPVYYNITQRGDLKIITIPIGDRVVFSLMDKAENHIQVVENIHSIFNNPKMFSHPPGLPIVAKHMECQ
ncbi:MAG: hypothetical protein ACREA1_07215 [Nitrosotalea sp.]